MAQANLEIPLPTDADSESVVTALEMATVFAARGDTSEAVRWVQRAAESAAESGNDQRTLALARTAAEMNGKLSSSAATSQPAAPEDRSASRQLPKLPPRASSPSPAPPEAGARGNGVARASEEETPLPLSRRAAPKAELESSSGLVQKFSTRPPPPSSRAHAAPTPSAPAGSLASSTTATSTPRPSQVPRYPTPPPLPATGSGANRRDEKPIETKTIGTKPIETRPSEIKSIGPRPIETKPIETRSIETKPIETRSIETKPIETKPIGTRSNDTRPSALPARASLSSPPPETSRAQDLPLRQAARVSVVPSATERGLYLFRVLRDGEKPPSGAEEAFLVLTNPDATLLRR